VLIANPSQVLTVGVFKQARNLPCHLFREQVQD
jgi:hypothetical protein